MGKISWDALGERIYEVGLDHAVIYFPMYNEFTNGVPWNGLTKVTDSGLDLDEAGLYSGDVKIGSEYSGKEHTGSIEAFTYPEEFDQCIGNESLHDGITITSQGNSPFGLTYRTLVGNDTEGTNKGYKIHFLYNVYILQHDHTFVSLSGSSDLSPLKWSYESYPAEYDGRGITHLILDMSKFDGYFLDYLEETLYGSSDAEPRLPLPDEIVNEWYGSYLQDSDGNEVLDSNMRKVAGINYGEDE